MSKQECQFLGLMVADVLRESEQSRLIAYRVDPGEYNLIQCPINCSLNGKHASFMLVLSITANDL